MATAWKVVATITVVGWLVSPVIAYFLPKILSSLGFDAKKKIRELEFSIMPELENTLGEVDQARMMQRGKRNKSDVAVLDKMAAMLRHAREDAEDIFDDAEEIEVYRNRCWQCLYGAVNASVGVSYGALKACVARCVRILSGDPTLDMLVNFQEQLQTLFGDDEPLKREWVAYLISKRNATEMRDEYEETLSRDQFTLIRELSEHIEASRDGLANKLRNRLYVAVATCKSRCVRPLQWVGMVNYGAVESSMWIVMQFPGKILSGCRHLLCVAVKSICTMWIASITWRGSDQQLPPEPIQENACAVASDDRAQLIADQAASNDLVMDIAASQEEAVAELATHLHQQAVPVTAASNDLAVDIADSDNEAAAPSNLSSHEEEFSESAAFRDQVSEATPSESDSNVEIISEATLSDLASDKEAVPKATGSAESASHEEIVSESSLSYSASDKEAVSEATPSEVPSNEATFADSASGEGVLEATLSVPVTAPTYISLHVFKNCYRSILYWLLYAYEKSCFYRDWSYAGAGITSYQENAIALDFLLTAVPRRNLKKQIENLESTISEVKKSPFLGVATKITPEIIANKNRSRIRTDSSRKVFGREALRDSIVAKLRENQLGTGPCYSVIGIYGVAGSGKTTFAQYTRDYIEKECKEQKLFDTIMCIHVSENFRVADIFHEMLKDITKDRHSNILGREEVEDKLKESLRGKRFCLILDDLWVKTKNDSQLEELISPLNVGLKGSKILVTARTKAAAAVLGVDEPMEMPDLDEDHYFSMFIYYALGGTSVTDEEFKRVGRVIAGKLHGSPIAAVILAGQLGANKDIRFWKNIAERDMLNDTMDALWWSYQQLSSDIKRCFEYCNIFPRRFKMEKMKLIHLWIAQGFVKTSYATEDMEDVAEGYIQELVSCSFLQQEDLQGEESFRMHDLLHDLADMVTRADSFRIENERGERWKGCIPRDVRHLFIQNYDAELITEEILGLGNLRTLIVDVVGTDTQVEEKIINSVCMKLPKLRVLAFAFSWKFIKESTKLSIPESLSQLKYLRYFAFRINNSNKVTSPRTNISCEIALPSTVIKLQHIQVLDFDHAIMLQFAFDKLVNLRHIFCSEFVKLPYVGRLSSLQTLPVFKVTNEQGCELKQLRDLNNLQGSLDIIGLENVKSKEEALNANLAAKRLTNLKLEWSFDFDTRGNPEVEADVIEGMCPPVGLETLDIWYYQGSRYPDWMVGKHNGGPKYLQELHIMKCSQQGPGPQLAEAFPHLRVLMFGFCSLDALANNMEHLTSLKELVIFYCLNIWYLPTLPKSLERFQLTNCNDELMVSCQTVGHPNWQKIVHIPYHLIWPSRYITTRAIQA